MGYIYAIEVFFPDPYDPITLCACNTEADAQEMILSIEETADYDKYLLYLENDPTVRPRDFPRGEYQYRTATYEEIMLF